MNLKKITRNKYNNVYNKIYLFYNRYRLLISFNIPKENEPFRLTYLDYLVIGYLFIMISGVFSMLRGTQHISLYLSSLMSLGIFFFSMVSLVLGVKEKYG